MSTAEALSLMLNFGMFILTLLMFIDKHHDKWANQKTVLDTGWAVYKFKKL